MESIGGLITFIVMIIFFIARASNKNTNSGNQQNQSSTSTAQRNPTLQSQLNRAMKQINEIKNIAQEEFNQKPTGTRQSVPKAQPINTGSQRPAYRSSLEGHQMEGHKVEGYKMEGHKVEGYKVEGHKVEGIEREHNTKKFKKGSYAVTESSMKRGYAGEGCDEHYDLELAYSSQRTKKGEKASLHFSDNPFVQGIVMSQILERPKRR